MVTNFYLMTSVFLQNIATEAFHFHILKSVVKLVRVADELSKGIDHVRVDLYLAKGKIYFGELTFSTGSGRIKWNPVEFDSYLGSLWDLDVDS